MKKIKLLVVTLISILILPISINAAAKEPIKVHIFKGDGCGYCAAALEFFESIEDEYGKYFDLVEHEVWYDEDNASLMTEVASYFEEEVNGVPYIIIGDKTFQGYTESYNEQIKNEIKSQYESGNFEDIVSKIENGNTKSSTKNKDNDNKTTIIIIAVALIGFVALFYFARDTEENSEVIKDKIEEKEKNEDIKKEEKKSSTKKVNTPKSTTKKSTNSKPTSTKKTTSANSKKSSTTKAKTATKKSTSKKNK